MYSVYQRWDPLKVCIVGRSYSPEFYSYINNSKVRQVFERIAYETEEDYQTLIKLLESFGVKVIRPQLGNDWQAYYQNGKIQKPPMTPRDYSVMMGNEFYFLDTCYSKSKANLDNIIKQTNCEPPAALELSPYNTSNTCLAKHNSIHNLEFIETDIWQPVIDDVIKAGNPVYNDVPWYLTNFNTATLFQIGKDIYLGNEYEGQDISHYIKELKKHYPGYRWHSIDTDGHADGTYSVIKPGLIVSCGSIPGSDYNKLFPGWEVVYLSNYGGRENITPFRELKKQNNGKWWVPGEELNNEFTEYVESWLGHWVGYVEETLFEVNMLVINEKNVVCCGYNKEVFDAFNRHGVTPHIINFRHKLFWDGGLHCITSDINRDGALIDCFPERLI
jgi:hypothetical protein